MFRWVIRVRVTSKSPIRTWSNSRGEGKLFSMDLIDESGEIRCTAFRDLCDKFYDMIEVCTIQLKSVIGIRFLFSLRKIKMSSVFTYAAWKSILYLAVYAERGKQTI